MATNKHFLQDRTTLLLVSIMSFLALAAVALILLRIGSVPSGGNYIVSYRASLGIDRYTTGTLGDVLGFVAAAILLFGMSLVLAYRSYRVRRELSMVVLALTIVLLLFLIFVSNSLLVLR
ncbi:MAG TPA: hypothetical protein VLG92_00135 [Candidatus Saccharimonadia bacterium]|nr:hypothetical protein [Candidatus Saccharimonadia bacterium]